MSPKTKINKRILVDVDGVILNWEYAFTLWMEQQGFIEAKDGNTMYNICERFGLQDWDTAFEYVKQFNESAAIGFLPPLRDSIEYITRLHAEGWSFIAITSVSANVYVQKLREKNLAKLFGKDVFAEVICLDTNAPKDDVLKQFEGSNLWWIEDKVDNAVAGERVGLRALVMEHGFNMHDNRCRRVKNWKEIYKIINN